MTDGTVANFLSEPNAVSDPLFNGIGGALDAMAQDPDACKLYNIRAGQFDKAFAGRSIQNLKSFTRNVGLRSKEEQEEILK
ncbi:MAG: hypothetical protein K8F91_07950 [Candidatus Obscuribacterales bacterium]|nr:hypothetical protein [Candidatus Obscuribacterales bacterium]